MTELERMVSDNNFTMYDSKPQQLTTHWLSPIQLPHRNPCNTRLEAVLAADVRGALRLGASIPMLSKKRLVHIKNG